MKKIKAFALFLFLIQFSFAQENPIYFADHPTLSPDGETIIFSFKNDLWQVAETGGIANRISAMDGNETYPKVSPDGKWLAFSSNQFGNNDVFIMPLGGGEVKQLTFHESGDQVSSWSWDSKSILFTSNRYNRMSTYEVNIDGGTPQRLFPNYFNNIHNAIKHPKTGEVYFNETWESSNFAHRKRYKGPYNPDIKSYNPSSKKFKVHTDYEGKDFGVSISRKGEVYFVSDEANGEYNLYTFVDGEKTQLTSFPTSVKSPSVNTKGTKIVFQKDYQIHLYDVKTQQTAHVPIQIPNNNTLTKMQNFKVQGNISEFDVASDGKKLAFVSRGELFVSDMKGKFVRQIPTSSLGRVLEVYWLKGDTSLIFNQTVDGYQNWFTTAANGKEKAVQRSLDKRNNRQLSFNKDKTRAVYFSGREDVLEMDLESFQSTFLFKDELWGFYNAKPSYSPDNQYLLYNPYRNFETDIMLYRFADKETFNITNTGVTEANPVWSPDGKYLYFTTNRTKPSYPYGLQNSDLYRMPLEKIEKPYRSTEFDKLFVVEKKDDKDEKAKDEETKDEEEKDDKKIKVTIDFDKPMKRIERIGPSFGSQGGAYVVQKDGKTQVVMASNHDEGKTNLWLLTMEDFEKTETDKIKGAETRNLNIKSAKGKHYVIVKGNIHELNLSGKKTEQIKINHSFQRNLQSEFEQMYFETWANMEENFYNESFHGVDWGKMRDSYSKFLPHLNSRADLRRMTNDLLGELNTSHFGFYSNGKEEKIFYGTRTLATGILFDNENPYQVEGIVPNSPADKVGIDIQKGDVLTAVNGQSVNANTNREFYFAKASMKEEIALGLKRGEKTITIKLHPTSYGSIRNAMYDDWIENNQQRVDEKSNKRIAYTYMKNMTGGQLEQFKIDMVSEAYEREALIFDLRYNTGGNVHDEVLQFLSQKPYLSWKYREGRLSPQPNFAPAGKPIILLINEQSLSDAEMTASGFKELGLGTIMGTGTYRWIIFTSGKGLVDGSFYRLPSWGCYSLDGKNLEKTGVEPDIYVKNTFMDRLEGKDPQLDRAILEILKILEANEGGSK